MTTTAGAVSNVAESAFAAAARTSPVQVPAPKAAPPPMVRLVIEEDQESGVFIYKTLDPATGEVLLQLPREDLLKALHSGAYAAGDVVKTRA